jgi:hypothetical protein
MWLAFPFLLSLPDLLQMFAANAVISLLSRVAAPFAQKGIIFRNHAYG